MVTVVDFFIDKNGQGVHFIQSLGATEMAVQIFQFLLHGGHFRFCILKVVGVAGNDGATDIAFNGKYVRFQFVQVVLNTQLIQQAGIALDQALDIITGKHL